MYSAGPLGSTVEPIRCDLHYENIRLCFEPGEHCGLDIYLRLFVCHRLSIMATGAPQMNGEVPHSPSHPGMLEETLHQMNILIQENRDLKGTCGGVLGCPAVFSFLLGQFAFI